MSCRRFDSIGVVVAGGSIPDQHVLVIPEPDVELSANPSSPSLPGEEYATASDIMAAGTVVDTASSVLCTPAAHMAKRIGLDTYLVHMDYGSTPEQSPKTIRANVIALIGEEPIDPGAPIRYFARRTGGKVELLSPLPFTSPPPLPVSSSADKCGLSGSATTAIQQ